MSKLEIINVTKKIKGRTVLENVNLSMISGKIYGLIGRNGSGKTMLIRCISGLMKPTSGTIKWDSSELYKDMDFIPDAGVIIENIGLCQQFGGFENLKLLSGIRKKISDDEICETMKRVGLDPEDTRPVKKYSLGMRQKLALVQALMEKPKLILLDEPTNSLDKESCGRLRRILKEEADRGACILIASHNSKDINMLCDEVYNMSSGILTKEVGEEL